MSEFPTEWHREAYADGCERELEGAERRIEEFTQRIAEAEEVKKNALAELIRIGRRKAEKRPRAKDSGKETRG